MIQAISDNLGIFCLGLLFGIVLGSVIVAAANTLNYILRVRILKKDLEKNMILAQSIAKLKAELK